MPDEILTRLRAIDPVSGPVAPPPIDRVRARIEAVEPSAAPTRGVIRGAGLGSRLVPALGVAVALAVAAVAIVALGHRAGSEPSRSGTAPIRTGPSNRRHNGGLRHRGTAPVLPPDGMAGSVQVWGAATTSSGAAAVFSLEQCHPCERTQSFAEWMARRTGQESGWTVTRKPFYLLSAGFSGGRDVWGDAQSRRGAVNEILVSHDGGGHWRRALTPVEGNEPGSLSVAADEVWASVPQCAATCGSTIEHGSAAGDRLGAAPTQPVMAMGDNEVQIVATGPHSAAISAAQAAPLQLVHPRLIVTHDDGRSWRTLASPCPLQTADVILAAAGPNVLWETCGANHGHSFIEVVAESSDGGRSWRTHRVPTTLHSLIPTGPMTAWAMSDVNGAILRTTDGGRIWTSVLPTSGNVQLVASSPLSATVAEVVGRGEATAHAADSNLLIHRTTDGGATWQASVVRLPRG